MIEFLLCVDSCPVTPVHIFASHSVFVQKLCLTCPSISFTAVRCGAGGAFSPTWIFAFLVICRRWILLLCRFFFAWHEKEFSSSVEDCLREYLIRRSISRSLWLNLTMFVLINFVQWVDMAHCQRNVQLLKFEGNWKTTQSRNGRGLLDQKKLLTSAFWILLLVLVIWWHFVKNCLIFSCEFMSCCPSKT